VPWKRASGFNIARREESPPQGFIPLRQPERLGRALEKGSCGRYPWRVAAENI